MNDDSYFFILKAIETESENEMKKIKIVEIVHLSSEGVFFCSL